MLRFAIRSIAVCWLLAARPGASAPGVVEAAGPRPVPGGSAGCLACHPSAVRVLDGPMATRASQRALAGRAFGRDADTMMPVLFPGEPVRECADCHGAEPHAAGRPRDEACLRCHNEASAGWEYYGRAPRDDHERYRRGPREQGEPFLRMRADVHRERGLACVACHTKASVHGGGEVVGCRTCHAQPSPRVPEHAIASHLQNMECVACHAAWAGQEYGTFLVHTADAARAEAFAPLRARGEWRKSAVLKRQDAPPLGLDAKGRVAPIRPRFVLFATDPRRGWENRLLAAEWIPFSPHTVRRGAVACGGCHDSPRRFLLEEDDARLYLLEKDGLALRSFWSQQGQTVVGGSFFPEERFARMNRRTPEYVRAHLRQWQEVLAHAAPPSRR